MNNADGRVVDGFGDEWSRFDQSALSERELLELFNNYFNIFPWSSLPQGAVGFDLGCGSGRWARFVAPKVRALHLIDASSQALDVAKMSLRGRDNCFFHLASVDAIPLPDGEADFGYSLGVLHHVPDTAAGMKRCVEKLKPGAPFLVYLYYAFDNRPAWFRGIWRLSDILRRFVSRQPHALRYILSQMLAVTLYWPLARISLLLDKIGMNVANMPLSSYRSCSFYVMRNDALDRFGTRLEQRFTRSQIKTMMQDAGLQDIQFSQTSFWTAVGYKK